MHPVGRLDVDTSGLLLFSSDGILTQRLLNPNSEIPRIYEAIVIGEVNHEYLQTTLRKGVSTTLGTFTANLVSSQILDEQVNIAYAHTMKNSIYFS